MTQSEIRHAIVPSQGALPLDIGSISIGKRLILVLLLRLRLQCGLVANFLPSKVSAGHTQTSFNANTALLLHRYVS